MTYQHQPLGHSFWRDCLRPVAEVIDKLHHSMPTVTSSCESDDQAVLVGVQGALANDHRGPAIAGTEECELQQ